jgi:hypothetical protein
MDADQPPRHVLRLLPLSLRFAREDALGRLLLQSRMATPTSHVNHTPVVCELVWISGAGDCEAGAGTLTAWGSIVVVNVRTTGLSVLTSHGSALPDCASGAFEPFGSLWDTTP